MVPIGTKSSGGVPVSSSRPKGSNTTQLSVPTGEDSSIGVPGLDNLTNDIQILGDGRKRVSVITYRKQLFVSRLTPQNITVEEFKLSYVRRISSFKIFAPPQVFNVLNSKSFWLNDELVFKEFLPNRRRTNNRPSKVVPVPNK